MEQLAERETTQLFHRRFSTVKPKFILSLKFDAASCLLLQIFTAENIFDWCPKKGSAHNAVEYYRAFMVM